MSTHNINWKYYFELCDILVDYASRDEFDAVVGVARGGLIPAQYIAYKLNIKKLYSLGISSYDNGITSNTCEIYQNLPKIDKSQRLLIVDEISDTGDTFSEIFELLIGYDIKTASLHYRSTSKFKPDYVAETIYDDKWVIYPYDINI